MAAILVAAAGRAHPGPGVRAGRGGWGGVSERGSGGWRRGVRHKGGNAGSSPFVVVLSDADREVLARRARSGRSEHRDRLRAQIVLAAAGGQTNAGIAARLRICVDTVRKWRKRFISNGLAGLRDGQRSGRPRQITDLERAEVTALACTLPAETGLPLSRFSHGELAAEATGRGLVAAVSASSVRRILHRAPIKPWLCRSWIHPATRISPSKPPGFWTSTTAAGRAGGWGRTTR